MGRDRGEEGKGQRRSNDKQEGRKERAGGRERKEDSPTRRAKHCYSRPMAAAELLSLTCFPLLLFFSVCVSVVSLFCFSCLVL